ncbi:MAG: type II secretion system protein [Candidatus Daviesbacteria bacterium]|nr:type II secretion system protein [Candidatus Daviesbacteria bacterium]
MKRLSAGFTLVELMVVISIIAILASVSIVLFTSSQASARDAKRRIELSALAKSIEASRDMGNGSYYYESTRMNADFPTIGLYNDPKGHAYCIYTSTSVGAPGAMTSAQNNNSVSCNVNNGNYIDLTTSVNPSPPTTANRLGNNIFDVKGWTLCALMERGTAPFCISSIAR